MSAQAMAQIMPSPCLPYSNGAPLYAPYRPTAPVVLPAVTNSAPLVLPYPTTSAAPSVLPAVQSPCSGAMNYYNPYLMYRPNPYYYMYQQQMMYQRQMQMSMFIKAGAAFGLMFAQLAQSWHAPVQHHAAPTPIVHHSHPIPPRPLPPRPIPPRPLPPVRCDNGPSMWDAVENVEKDGVIPPGQHNDDDHGGIPTIVNTNGQYTVRLGPTKVSNCVNATAAAFDQHIVDLANAHKIKLTAREINVLNGDQVHEAIWGNTYSMAKLMARMGGESMKGDRDGGDLIQTLEQAKPGDFLKFDRVARTGHSTVFKNLKRDQNGKVTDVCYWSSDQGTDGVGTQCESISVIQDVVVSRFPEHPDFDKLVDNDNPNNSILTQKVDYISQFSAQSTCENVDDSNTAPTVISQPNSNSPGTK